VLGGQVGYREGDADSGVCVSGRGKWWERQKTYLSLPKDLVSTTSSSPDASWILNSLVAKYSCSSAGSSAESVFSRSRCSSDARVAASSWSAGIISSL
jgi:hypothetical protein